MLTPFDIFYCRQISVSIIGYRSLRLVIIDIGIGLLKNAISVDPYSRRIGINVVLINVQRAATIPDQDRVTF